VPELPEVEITARRISAAVRGVAIESTLAPGVNALKTFDPPLRALDSRPCISRVQSRLASRRCSVAAAWTRGSRSACRSS